MAVATPVTRPLSPAPPFHYSIVESKTVSDARAIRTGGLGRKRRGKKKIPRRGSPIGLRVGVGFTKAELRLIAASQRLDSLSSAYRASSKKLPLSFALSVTLPRPG